MGLVPMSAVPDPVEVRDRANDEPPTPRDQATISSRTHRGWRISAALAAVALILVAPAAVRAQGAKTAGGGLPNFDVRVGKEAHALRGALNPSAAIDGHHAALLANTEAATVWLKQYIPGLIIDVHPLSGVPEVIAARGMFLTTPAPSTPPEEVVRNFLGATSALYALSPIEIDSLTTTASYANPTGNLKWVSLEQRVNGIPVFRGELRAAVTSNGEIAAIVNETVPGLDPAGIGGPTRSPVDVIAIAAQNIGVTLVTPPALLYRSDDGLRHRFERGPFADEITLELIVFPLAPGKAVLAWKVLLWQRVAAYYVVVDDASGQVLFRKNITNDQSQTATFDAYASHSPAPLAPSNATPGSGIQGAATPRTRFTLTSDLPGVNNLGWIPDGSCVTTGNNVDAGLDIDGIDGIDPNGRATGVAGGPSPGCRNFTFSYNPPPGIPPPGDLLTGANYRLGVVTNLFFWSNRYHDRLYTYGFTEAARNFQNDNFGRGGLGGDPVRAQAQDFSGTNNANFGTPSDGAPPRMQMYVFDGPNPDRDGSLDQDVVLHELTHGVSNRLVGNAVGLTNQQGGSMGEGWSDFYALSLLALPTDDPNGVYAAGAYVTLNLGGPFTDNYFYGIRRFPYTTNMALNPLTFADIDPVQVNLGGGIYPSNPVVSGAPANEVHASGEIWASMLWEARANVIARLGAQAGNDRMLQVTTDGLKLTPAAPTFAQARNAIIQANCGGFAGADEVDIWRGFAKRGLGFSAVAPPSASTNHAGTIEAFDLPLVPGLAAVSDTAGGNGNGTVDPGETIDLTIPLTNSFTCTALSGVTGTLSSNTAGVTINQASVNYGNLAAGGGANGAAYQFRVGPGVPCGTQILFTLTLTWAGGPTTTRTIAMNVGPVGTPTTFTYTGPPVAIPDNNPAGGVATLVVPGSFRISDVNLNLTNVTHTFIGDLFVQLLSPDGTPITMINRLPNGTGMNASANFTNTILDDEAVNSIQPQTGFVTNASFKPATPLSGFDGKFGNGTWTLKIIDQASIDVGTITAWSLTLTPQGLACSAYTPQPFTLTVARAGSGSGTVTSVPAGVSCGAACAVPYDRGTHVTLAATPTAGSTFDGWSGGGCSGTGLCDVTLAGSLTVTATFKAIRTLTVTKAGTGSGIVASTPTGIDCGVTCSAGFLDGTPVTLTAQTTQGAFAGWSGAGVNCAGAGTCQVTMDGDRTVTATFSGTVTLSVNARGSAPGTVTSDTGGIGVNCTPTCSASANYAQGALVTLTAAAADATWTWSGACSTVPESSPTCVVVMSASLSVGVKFSRNFPDLTLVPASTQVSAVHITSLRSAINQLRSFYQAGTFTFTDGTLAPGSTQIQATHFIELRTALCGAYITAERTCPTYLTDPTLTPGATTVKAQHLTEIRENVRSLE